MGLSARSHSTGVPTLRNLQQTEAIQDTLEQALKAEDYAGGYSKLSAFIRSWRGEQGKSLCAFVALTFALGEAFQFDWSEEGLLICGLFRRTQVSHMKLCASRAFWLVAHPLAGKDSTIRIPAECTTSTASHKGRRSY